MKIDRDCELGQNIWAVIDAHHIRANDLTYDQAEEYRDHLLSREKNPGICIVTAQAARKMEEGKNHG